MFRSFVVLAVFFALAFAQVPQNCSNPIFQGCNTGGGCIDFISDVPVERTGSCLEICKFDASGDTCCQPQTCDAIKEVFTEYRNALAQVYNQFKDAKPQEFDIDAAIDQQCTPDLEQQLGITCDQLKKVMKAVYAAYVQLFEDLANGLYSCYSAVLRYFAGIICFACSPNWGAYLVPTDTPGVYILQLSTSTCTDLKEGCLPLFQAAYKFVKAVSDAVAELGDSPFADAIRAQISSFAGSIDNPCGDMPCEDYICEGLVQGVVISNSINFIGGGRKRFADEHRGTVLEHFGRIFDSASDTLASFEQKKRELDSTKAALSASATNQYVANGYAATKAGSKSGLETSPGENPEGDSSSSAAHIAAGAAVLAGAAAALFA